jgi:hypothetical protein
MWKHFPQSDVLLFILIYFSVNAWNIATNVIRFPCELAHVNQRQVLPSSIVTWKIYAIFESLKLNINVTMASKTHFIFSTIFKWRFFICYVIYRRKGGLFWMNAEECVRKWHFLVLILWSRSAYKYYLRIQSVLQIKHHTSPLQRFSTILRVNSDYFLKQR